MLARILSVVLLCAGLLRPAQAQVSQTGAGKGAPGGGGGAYVGPMDAVPGALGCWSLQACKLSYVGNAANICTPSDVTCLNVTVSQSTLNATTLATLGCNNTTVICTVKTFYDQSGALSCSGGSTACDVTNATIAERPIFVAALAGNGCTTTSLPCLSWPGTATTTGLFGSFPSTSPLTLSAVALVTSISSNQAVFGSTSDPIMYAGAAPVFGIFAGVGVVTSAISLNTWYAVQGVFDDAGTNTAIYVNGSNSTGTVGTDSLVQVHMGANSVQAALIGKSAEYLVYGSAFTTQKATMNSNQRTRWGF